MTPDTIKNSPLISMDVQQFEDGFQWMSLLLLRKRELDTWTPIRLIFNYETMAANRTIFQGAMENDKYLLTYIHSHTNGAQYKVSTRYIKFLRDIRYNHQHSKDEDLPELDHNLWFARF